MPDRAGRVPGAGAARRALLAFYREPALALQAPPALLAATFAAARRSRAIAHLGLRLDQAGVLARLDERARGHFESATVLVLHQRQRIVREMHELALALRGFDGPVVLLKGGAYIAAGLPMSGARVTNDIDLLVPRAGLDAVERLLAAGGWRTKELVAYDERYYREWSQELPPFVDPEREVEVDVHHAITPDLREDGVDSEKLFERSVEIEWDGGRRFRVLDPVDQLLHCAVHTYKDSDLSLRLRETMDFDLLFRHHGAADPAGLAARLAVRAADLGQQRPVWWAAHFARRWLATPIPADSMRALPAPSALVVATMNALVDGAMLPGSTAERRGFARVAAIALLARYHHHRMPLRMLVPHLLEKSSRRLRTMQREPDDAA